MGMILFMAVPTLSLAGFLLPAGAKLHLMAASQKEPQGCRLQGSLQDEASPTDGRVSSQGPVEGDSSDRLPVLFSRRAIHDRARDWELKRLEGCGWTLLKTKRCAIRGELRAEEIRTVGVYADAFLEAIEEALQGDSGDIRFSVRVFRDPDAFDGYATVAGARGAASFYDPRMQEAVMVWSETDPPWRLLMHELTHMYLDRVFNRREPLWLSEGLAEYFAAYEGAKNGSITFGREPAVARELVRRALEGGTFIPMERLLAVGRDTFYGEAHALHYAAARSLVMFLAMHQDEDRPHILRELVRGKDLSLIWDMRELEERWSEWVRDSK